MATYQGSCHCGSVQFEIDSELDSPIRCNCSLCSRKGALMHRVPHEHFRILGGEGAIECYQWNTRKAKHYFCRHCGIYTHHQPRTAPDMMGINMGCLEGVDIKDMPFNWVDGASLSLELEQY